jgi:hypothetical protein
VQAAKISEFAGLIECDAKFVIGVQRLRPAGLVQAPIVEQAVMQPIFADDGQFAAQTSVEIVEDFRPPFIFASPATPRLVTAYEITSAVCSQCGRFALRKSLGGDLPRWLSAGPLVRDMSFPSRTSRASDLTVGAMRLRKQGADGHNAATATRRAAKASIGLSWRTRRPGVEIPECREDLRVR